GTHPSCWSPAYTVVNNATWLPPGVTASVTITETLIPAGIQVDSVQITNRFGITQTTILHNPTVVVIEGANDIHTIKYFNAALPSVSCAAINAVINQPLTPVTLTA